MASEVIIEDEGTLTEETLQDQIDKNKENESNENDELENSTKEENELSENTDSKENNDTKENNDSDSLSEADKWKKFARQHESEKKKLKSENDELIKKLEESNSELEKLKHSLIVNEVVSELGLNEKQASFLSGKNKEELIKSGNELIDAFSSAKKVNSFKQGMSDGVQVSQAPKTRAEAFRSLQSN